jgi:hypothetical protein
LDISLSYPSGEERVQYFTCLNDFCLPSRWLEEGERESAPCMAPCINFMGNAFNENKYAVGVFFYLKKALDVCSHEILLMKLERMGVRDTALQWFKNYLANRKQKVDINGKLSEERGIEISIMQGSILGPILFLCYINDLHTVTSLLTLMFADDTFRLKSGHNLTLF